MIYPLLIFIFPCQIPESKNLTSLLMVVVDQMYELTFNPYQRYKYIMIKNIAVKGVRDTCRVAIEQINRTNSEAIESLTRTSSEVIHYMNRTISEQNDKINRFLHEGKFEVTYPFLIGK